MPRKPQSMDSSASEQLQPEHSLTGLEQIFEQTKIQESHLNIAPILSAEVNNHEQIVCSIDPPFELVSMAEAARRMKIPYPTLRRRVLRGKVESVRDVDGKPLVKLNTPDHAESSTNTPEHLTEQNGFSSESSMNIQSLIHELTREREYSRSLVSKLEYVNHRNGYLESQIELQREQLKLLTTSDNSGNNQSWWHRFSSWFFGIT